MNPFTVIIAIVALFNLVGVPYAYYVPHKERPDLFAMMRFINDEMIWRSYRLTVYATLMLIGFCVLFGVTRRMRAYQRRADDNLAPETAYWMWYGSLFAAWACIAIMFVQADFHIPVLDAILTKNIDYVSSSILRTYYDEAVNQSLYNLNLLIFIPINLALAYFAFQPRRRFMMLVSLSTFVVGASFSLSKSRMAAAINVLVFVIILRRRVPLKWVVAMGMITIALIMPFYFIYAYGENLTEVSDALLSRIIYGQWAGLPYYFILFEHDQQPPYTLLPPYMQSALGRTVDSPGRKIMIYIEPSAALEGVAGNVPSFFVGEAYAIAGNWGVVLAPLLAALELWLVAACFAALPKNPITLTIYAWLLFRFAGGLVGGASAFVVSGFTECLFILLLYVIVREAAMRPRRRPAFA